MCEKKPTSSNSSEQENRVNNNPIEKPHLKNIEQTSQKWVYIEKKRIAD